ncbi:MAG: hypothetical protein JNL81_07955 [Hyphomonadaceae bacterium]|nr:hypothetical protein [Hyphomonadaceae bacterium]
MRMGIFGAVMLACMIGGSPVAAQTRPTAVIANVVIDRALRDTVRSDFTSILRRELELSLDSTQLFSLPTRDRAELDAVIDEIARTGRGGGPATPVDMTLVPTITAYELTERRRPAPFQTQRDLVTLNGSLSLQITVLNARDASVVARFPLDVRYTDDGRVVDANASSGTRDANGSAYLGLAREAGRALAAHLRARNPQPATAAPNQAPMLVAERADNRIWIVSSSGLALGDELRVFGAGGREIRHPQTGELLGTTEQVVGRVRVVELQPRMAIAEIIETSGEITVGATVRR